jgi:hypothetical protein
VDSTAPGVAGLSRPPVPSRPEGDDAGAGLFVWELVATSTPSRAPGRLVPPAGRFRALVPLALRDGPPTELAGDVWLEQDALLEHPFQATWTRRGAGDVFDGVHTSPTGQRTTATFTARVSAAPYYLLPRPFEPTGPRRWVMVQRRQGSDLDDCDYFGGLTDDGATMSGIYACAAGAHGSWSAAAQPK